VLKVIPRPTALCAVGKKDHMIMAQIMAQTVFLLRDTTMDSRATTTEDVRDSWQLH
jgi:hypothetical protein